MLYSKPVVPNLFCSRANYSFLEGMGSHKVNLFAFPSTPPPTAMGPGDAVNSPAESGAESQPATHFRAFLVSK